MPYVYGIAYTTPDGQDHLDIRPDVGEALEHARQVEQEQQAFVRNIIRLLDWEGTRKIATAAAAERGDQ